MLEMGHVFTFPLTLIPHLYLVQTCADAVNAAIVSVISYTHQSCWVYEPLFSFCLPSPLTLILFSSSREVSES